MRLPPSVSVNRLTNNNVRGPANNGGNQSNGRKQNGRVDTTVSYRDRVAEERRRMVEEREREIEKRRLQRQKILAQRAKRRQEMENRWRQNNRRVPGNRERTRNNRHNQNITRVKFSPALQENAKTCTSISLLTALDAQYRCRCDGTWLLIRCCSATF